MGNAIRTAGGRGFSGCCPLGNWAFAPTAALYPVNRESNAKAFPASRRIYAFATMRRTLRNCANWIALLVGNSAGYSINATRGKPKANMTQEEATNWALKKIEGAMDKPKQPTAAAMRAAKTIADASGLSYAGIRGDAAIIDRETGLPELLAVLKLADRAIDEEKDLQASRGESVSVQLSIAQSAMWKAINKLEESK